MVVPGVVSTLMWKNIYAPNIGALNSFLDAVGLSAWKHSWLGEESTALWSIIFMGFPFVNSFAFLVYYGGLINIPTDLFEAAKVDGSRPLWNFWHIHMPLISPQLKMLIITTFISSVQDYGGVYLLTAGGQVMGMYLCRTFIAGQPPALFESARIDGATEFKAFYLIAVPLAKPILATLVVMNMISLYGDFIWPLLVIDSNSKQVISVAIQTYSSSQGTANYGAMIAGFAMATVPLLLMFMFSSRLYIEGITSGAVKA